MPGGNPGSSEGTTSPRRPGSGAVAPRGPERPRDQQFDMALWSGSLVGSFRVSAALLSGRWLQARLGPGLPIPARGKARGNEYQPSNIKRKHKHGWVRRLSTAAGVQVVLRRMLKGRKSLSH
ncbi:large ribosomal subunit protein bL34m [Thomomys bottae]